MSEEKKIETIELRWIPVSERRPTDADTDPEGNVLISCESNNDGWDYGTPGDLNDDDSWFPLCFTNTTSPLNLILRIAMNQGIVREELAEKALEELRELRSGRD